MDQKENIMNYETVALDDQDHSIVIIDQTLLPGRTELIRLRTAQEIWNAIYLLQVRGAPAIGVTAAFGIYLLARQIQMGKHWKKQYLLYGRRSTRRQERRSLREQFPDLMKEEASTGKSLRLSLQQTGTDRS